MAAFSICGDDDYYFINKKKAEAEMPCVEKCNTGIIWSEKTFVDFAVRLSPS